MKTSQIVFKLQGGHRLMTQITSFNVQNDIIPKLSEPVLSFLSSARFHFCKGFMKICQKVFELHNKLNV